MGPDSAESPASPVVTASKLTRMAETASESIAVQPAVRPARLPQVFTRPTTLQLGGMVLASTLVRYLLARLSPIPWLMPDEYVYGEYARGIAHGELLHGLWSFGPLYPAAVAAVDAFLAPARAFAAVQALNCALFSTAALPAYALARRVLSPKAALAAAGFALLVPSGIYTARLMSESLAYPLALCSLLAIVRALESGSLLRQAVAILAVGAAAAARPELAALLPAFAAAAVVLAFIESRLTPGRSVFRLLRPFALLGLVTLVSAAAVAEFALRGTAASAHGFAATRVSLAPLAHSLLAHLGLLDLYVGVAPFAAAVYLVRQAIRGLIQRSERVIAVVAVTTTLALSGVSACYLSALPRIAGAPSVHVFDRYTFYAAPLLLLCLLIIAEHRRDAPSLRMRAAMIIGAVVPLAALPLDRLLRGGEWGSSASSLALLPFSLLDAASHSVAMTWAGLVMIALLPACLFASARSGYSAPKVVAALFCLLGLLATLASRVAAEDARVVGGTPGWVDDVISGRANAVIVWSARPRGKDWYGVWETALANHTISAIYDVRSSFPHSPLHRSLGSTPLRVQYVVASRGLRLGQPLARSGDGKLILYRASGPIYPTAVRDALAR